ncbi:MAG: ImmA/IrrE family metallo-endopeptidase [Rhodothermia bacterium]|nr:MAG: ImmA/IrrE family metallo-endopeptidase [Rhodothermia bacterium]
MVKSVTNQYKPDYVSTPGSTLKDLLDERNLSQAELATRMGRPKKTINEIINGKAAITQETALELELVLGIPARFWNTREQYFREYLARQNQDNLLAKERSWASKFPLKEMAASGFLPKVKDPSENVKNLLQYLGVSSPEQWEKLYTRYEVAFRRSSAFDVNDYSLGAWLRAGILGANQIRLAPFSKSKFVDALNSVRSLTRSKPDVFLAELETMCAESGVAVVFVPQLPKSCVSGATRWISPSNALIQLSLRYKTNDHLWFTFFHEAAHVLLHGKRAIFLDNEKNEGEEEQAANRWAANFLIPPDNYRNFVANQSFAKADINELADQLGIAPGIVVGRLQHDRILRFNQCNDLKVKYSWSPKTAS